MKRLDIDRQSCRGGYKLRAETGEHYIWITSGGRITTDEKSYGESFSLPHDQPVMTLDEFKKGITIEKFEELVEEAKEARKA